MPKKSLFRTTSAILCLMMAGLFIACRERPSAPSDQAWLDSVFEKGRALFFQTVRSEISSYPERARLTEVEMQKIQQAETRYGRLYGILANVFYQKDEPDPDPPTGIQPMC